MRLLLRHKGPNNILVKQTYIVEKIPFNEDILNYLVWMLDTEDPDTKGKPPKNFYRNVSAGKLGSVDHIECYIVKDSDPSGFLLGITKEDGFHILSLCVKPDKRSKGIGSNLLKHVKEIHKDIYLNVHIDNKKAYRLYTDLGFEKGV